MLISKNEFSNRLQFDLKMIHVLTFLCLTTFIVNPAGEVINSSEFEQIGDEKGLCLQLIQKITPESLICHLKKSILCMKIEVYKQYL